MKTNPFLKLTFLLGFLFLLLAPKSSFAQGKDYENRYIILYVPAQHQENKTAYISNPIYYSTIDKCGKDREFIYEAKVAFITYLNLHHKDIFPYKGIHNITEISYEKDSSIRLLKTKQQTENRLNLLKSDIASEKRILNKFIQTNFSYGCE